MRAVRASVITKRFFDGDVIAWICDRVLYPRRSLSVLVSGAHISNGQKYPGTQRHRIWSAPSWSGWVPEGISTSRVEILEHSRAAIAAPAVRPALSPSSNRMTSWKCCCRSCS